MAIKLVVSAVNISKGPGTFRLLLALLVVFHHTTKYVKLGEFAVYVFFMLSGYWIFKMYNEKYSRLQTPFLSFIVSRWFRIYPTYILNFLLLLIFVYVWVPEQFQTFTAAGQTHFWVSSLMLLSYNQLAESSMLLVPAWSLDIELQFYLVFPFLFLCLRRFRPVLIGVLLVTIELLLSNVFQEVFKNSFLPAMHFFMIGIMICIYDFKPTKTLVIYSVLLFIIILSINYIHPVLRANMFKSNRDLLWMGVNYHWLLSTALALSIIPVVAASVTQVSTRFDRFMGNLSYDIYLFHWVLLIPYNYYFSQLPFVQRLPYFFIYLSLTLLGGTLMNKYFDKPVEAFRNRWLKRTQQELKMALLSERKGN